MFCEDPQEEVFLLSPFWEIRHVLVPSLTSSHSTAVGSKLQNCISVVREMNRKFRLPNTDASKVSVLDCLLRGWNRVLKLSDYSEYSTFSLFIPHEILLIYYAGVDPALLKFQCESIGGSQPFPGWYRVTWLVTNEKLLTKPRTERCPVNVHSHLCMARYPAGQTWRGSGERYGCSFAGLTKALSLCWLDVYWWSSRQLVRHGQTASDLAYRLPNNNFYTCRVVVYQICTVCSWDFGLVLEALPLGLTYHWTMY